MKSYPTESSCKLNECFRLRFQRRLAHYRVQHGSAAEGFGVIWEKTLEEVPVEEEAQSQLYRDLIGWAKSEELFAPQDQMSNAVRITEDNRACGPQDHSEMCRCLMQEAKAEIQQFHSLTRYRRVLEGRSHVLAEDLRNLYGTTKKLFQIGRSNGRTPTFRPDGSNHPFPRDDIGLVAVLTSKAGSQPTGIKADITVQPTGH